MTKRIISILAALSLIFSFVGVASANNAVPVEKWLASADGVTFKLSDTVNSVVAEFDGVSAQTSYLDNTNKLLYVKPEGGISADEMHTVVLKSGGSEQKYLFMLDTLLSDDFTSDVEGWNNATHDLANGYMEIPRDKVVTYTGGDLPAQKQSELTDYILQYEIKNSSNEYRLLTSLRGFTFTLRSYGTVFAGLMYPANVQSDFFNWLSVLGKNATITEHNGGIHVGLGDKGGNPYATGTFQSIVCGDMQQSVYNNGAKVITTNVKTGDSYLKINRTDTIICDCPSSGGFSFATTSSDNPVLLDNVKVYEFVNISENPVPFITGLEIIRNEDGSCTANYDYNFGAAEEGESAITWYYEDETTHEFVEISGQNEKTLPFSEEYSYKALKVVVLPVSVNGDEGISSSAVVYPLTPPVAANVTISGSGAIGSTLTADFDFSDLNSDAEGEHVYEWLASASADGEYTELLELGESYTVTDDDLGKYIKVQVTPMSVNAPYHGEPVMSEGYVYISPVLDIPSVKYINKSFYVELPAEANNLTVKLNGEDAVYKTAGNIVMIEGADKTENSLIYIKAGNQYAYISCDIGTIIYDDFDDGIDGWTANVPEGVAYSEEREAMILPVGKNSTVTYSALNQQELANYGLEFDVVNSSRNFKLYVDIHSGADDAYRAAIREYTNTGVWYVYGLYQKSMHGSVITADTLMGNTETPYLVQQDSADMPLTCSIMSINNKQELYTNGTKQFEFNFSNCESGGFSFWNYDTYSDIFIDNVRLYKVSYDVLSGAPTASNVLIDGSCLAGQTLSATVDYNHTEGASPGEFEYVWYASETKDGIYKPIEGATLSTLAVTSELESKYIKFSVCVIDEYGAKGECRFSNIVTKPCAPEISELAVSGANVPGGELTIDYKFYDANDDAESGTVIEWYTSETENGEKTVISGQNSKVLSITDELMGKYIYAKVVPKTTVEPTSGIEYMSEGTYIYYKPEISNLTLVRENTNIIRAEYDFISKDNKPEGETKYKWTVNGAEYTDINSVTIDPDKATTVTLTVTPAISDPYLAGESKTVSATFGISNNGGAAGGFAGGGGGAPASLGAVADSVIALPAIPEQEKVITEFNDIKSHWCAEYAQKVCDEGIMEASDKKNFFPDLIVTRAEFSQILAKTTGINEESYTGAFTDVLEGEYFAGYIQALLNMRIISEDETFNPYSPVTREQICKMTVIALGIEIPEEYDISYLKDYNKISEWARPYVAAAIQNGVMSGTGDDTFSPDTHIDRAQTAALVVKMMNYISGQEESK